MKDKRLLYDTIKKDKLNIEEMMNVEMRTYMNQKADLSTDRESSGRR